MEQTQSEPQTRLLITQPRTWLRLGPLAWLRTVLTAFKEDLRVAVPADACGSRWTRIKWRTRFLYRRYGWKLILTVVLYYLVRDLLLYVILPYFVARQII